MKKKGFTLIELLAVIVILAIIALIATPIVMNVIENSKKGSAERSIENLEKAAELYYYENKLEGGFPDITFTCKNGSCSSNDKVLKINGKVPETGLIIINKDGTVTLDSIVISGYSCYKENERYKCDKVVKESKNSNNGVLTLDSEITQLSNYRIYGNSVDDDIFVDNLPEEYQQVEYIESTGTQYIETETYLKSEYDVEFKFSTSSFATSESKSFQIFSSYGAEDKNWHYSANLGGIIGQNELFGWKYYASNYSNVNSTKKLSINTNYTIKTYGDIWYINDSEFTNGASNTMEPGKTSPAPLKLFGGDKPFDAGNLKIYYFKVFNGEELVARFVPVSHGEDVGMYDTVSGKFYTNSGTGEFLKGRDIHNKKSVGDYNSSTQKYEIPIKVTGKNLWNNNYASILTNLNDLGGGYRGLNINVGKGNTVAISFKNQLTPSDFTYLNIYANDKTYWLHGKNTAINKISFVSNYSSIGVSANIYNDETMKKFNDLINKDFQIEIGSTYTEYEPYREENYNIYLDEPLRCVDEECDYIDFNSGKVVRKVSVDNKGILLKLEKSILENIELPNIKLGTGINNIFVETNITPINLEVDYYK